MGGFEMYANSLDSPDSQGHQDTAVLGCLDPICHYQHHITVLGLMANSEQNFLTPKQSIQFIGMKLDSLIILATLSPFQPLLGFPNQV